MSTVRRRKKDKIKITISIILIIVSILAVAFVLLWNSKPFDIQEGNVFDPTTHSNYNPDNVVSTEKQINFLFVGVDVSESLTDVMMVVSVDVEKKSMEILQIPRDSYVSQLSTTGKMNSMYSFQGEGFKDLKKIERTIKVIYEQFQLPIDYYAVINLETFRDVVDAMGGIPIDLPEKLVIDKYNSLPAGEQVLDGEKAEWFVRHRSSYNEGDIGRVKAQRIFLAAAFDKAKNLGISSITKIIPEIVDDLVSNMAVKDMVNFAQIVMDIEAENIRIHMVPGEPYNFKNYEGKVTNSVFALHREETAELLNEYFRPYSEDIDYLELDIIPLANNGHWYENTDDNFDDLIDGVKPGQKNEDESSETD